MKKEDLKKANEWLQGKLVNIKGKEYALVADRVTAFRMICPDGLIQTEILSEAPGVVTMKTTICKSDGQIIATGIAQEKESNGFVNKTSYYENCETSAVGRALGFAGIGIDESMASAEEVATAMKTQAQKPVEEAPAFTETTVREQIIKYCRSKKLSLKEIEEDFHLKGKTEEEKKEIFEQIKDRFGE